MALPRRSSGYTLAEMLTVILILAIIAAVVVPQAVSGSGEQALSAARIIASDLDYARDLSIAGATPITVTFDANGESYVLTKQSQNIVHPITKASSYVVNF